MIQFLKERAIWLAFAVMTAIVLGVSGYVIRGLNQAFIASMAAARNAKTIEKNVDTLHMRISNNHKKIDTVKDTAIENRTNVKCLRDDVNILKGVHLK